MRTTQAHRYARWAATAAFVLLAAVAAVYFYRAWQARQAKKMAPPVVPATVEKSTAEFSFSKVEQDRTLFTVRASRATEFKEKNRSVLEDVWITIYGRKGQRFDNVHTHACDYLPTSGRIECAGEVQIDLESAEDARLHAAGHPDRERVIHVGTRGVSFERNTGVLQTEQRVEFSFPEGKGQALGVRYRSSDGVVRLLHDVELTLAPDGATGPRSAPVVLTGGSLEISRETRTLRLSGQVEARQGAATVTAGELSLELNHEFRASRLVARDHPEFRGLETNGASRLSSDELVAEIRPNGWLSRISAAGNVRGEIRHPGGQDQWTAARMDLGMTAAENQPRDLTASGGVTVASRLGNESRQLKTSSLRMFFRPQRTKSGPELQHGETQNSATLILESPSASDGRGAKEFTLVRAGQMAVEFNAENRLKQLTGRHGIEIERRLPGRPVQTTTAKEFEVAFDQRGSWIDLIEVGDVKLSEADRTAQADRARLDRASGMTTLTGHATVSDLRTRTTAQAVSFEQRTGEFRAEGGVVTRYLSSGSGAIANLAPQPAYLTAPHLIVTSAPARAVYSGGARLWQGESVIEASAIELDRQTQTLRATGGVRAVFPQSPSTAVSPTQSGRPVAPGAGPTPGVWRVRSEMLTYWSEKSRALLENGVVAEARQGQIHSRLIELFLGTGVRGGQQLVRAVASGGVTVRQGERRGTSDRAEYLAADEKFVLSGGKPTLYDAFRGTVTGRQLTFFFANDTIIVESEEGSRTLTRFRVEK